MSKEFDFTKYPEGVEYLAEHLTLPMEGKEAREAFVFGFIKGVISL